MAVLDILTAPHPVLEKKARDVRDDELGDALEALASDMAETMYAAPGVGLAAPQVGDARRLLVIDSGEEGGKGLLKMVNPVIVARSVELIPWRETCLSVPDFDVEVDRHRHVTVEWRTPSGERRRDDFHDFEAVIFQHEHDHLMGTILLDKVSAFRRSRYLVRARKAKAAPQPTP
jgi:peptide deformylase